MCFELIPSLTERSVLFVKEMSFPQTAPTDDAFFNRTGLERIGVVVPEIGLLLGWSTSSGCGTPLQKNKKEGGSAGASLVAAPMPKSVPR